MGRPAKHGASNDAGNRLATPEYSVWLNMRNRCTNPKNPSYKNYGARGIRVCPQWDDFRVFLKDVGLRPSPDLTIERIETDGNYEPGNIRWASRKDQVRNRRCTKLTVAYAAAIRTEFAAGASRRSLGLRYGVSATTINSVVRGEIWKS